MQKAIKQIIKDDIKFKIKQRKIKRTKKKVEKQETLKQRREMRGSAPVSHRQRKSKLE